MSTQVPARAQRLYSIWQRLPADPMTERQLEEAILGLLDGPAREADASAYMSTLRHAQAVIATRNGDGGIVFRKAAEFPTWPEAVGPGSRAYDEQTAELADAQKVRLDAVDEEAWRHSPQARQRSELLAFIHEAVGQAIDERFDRLRRELPGLVRRHLDEVAVRARVQAVLDGTDAVAKATGDVKRAGAEPDQEGRTHEPQHRDNG
jgi:hypothetical protein